MPRNLTLYKIFIASPSDLKEERKVVEEVIDELNLSAFHNSEIKLELLKWETHANPDFGSYPQEVINNDIGEFDVFIGLLWSRYGSPTPYYGSGTEEEYSLAYEKYQLNPNSMAIMFYFKQAPIPFDLIDTKSIESIRNFKSKIGNKGLFWDYTNVEEFQKLLRIQLTRKIKDLVSKQSAQIESPIVPLANFVNAENEDELGLIDYLELGEESFSDTNETLFRMKDLIEWIGKKFIDKTSEINQFALMDQHQMNHGLKRRLINSIAVDMNSFTGRFTGETSLFSQYYQSAIDSYSKAVKISCELKSDSIEDVDNIIDSVTGFIDTIKTANEQNQTFLDAINNLPKMTKEVNQARRKMSQVIMNLITEFDIAINLSGALREEFVNYKEKL